MTDWPVRWGNGGFQEVGGNTSNGGGGVDTLLRTMVKYHLLTRDGKMVSKVSLRLGRHRGGGASFKVKI